MARSGSTLTIAIFAIVLAVSFQEAFSLRCWNCDSQRNPSCGYPFEESKLDKAYLQDCQPRIGSQEPPVCLKISSSNNYIRRTCVNSKSDVNQQCSNNAQIGQGPRNIVCDECNTDGCNGAAQYGPAAIIVAIPMVFVKIFSLL